MKRFTKDQLKDYCKQRPPAMPNPNDEPHKVFSIETQAVFNQLQRLLNRAYKLRSFGGERGELLAELTKLRIYKLAHDNLKHRYMIVIDEDMSKIDVFTTKPLDVSTSPDPFLSKKEKVPAMDKYFLTIEAEITQ
jgi:hypothetical protein